MQVYIHLHLEMTYCVLSGTDNLVQMQTHIHKLHVLHEPLWDRR